MSHPLLALVVLWSTLGILKLVGSEQPDSYALVPLSLIAFLEIAIAGGALWARTRRLALYVSLVVSLGFFLVAIAQLVLREEVVSCGCLGPIPGFPWVRSVLASLLFALSVLSLPVSISPRDSIRVEKCGDLL